MAMRDQIRESIMAGGATKESLLELTGTTEKGLASQFTYLRMMGTCPMKQEDGTWKIVSADEWEAHRGSGGGAGKILTPAERLDKAEKRSKRAATAYDNAKKRHEANEDDELNRLKFVKAEAEFMIAEIELGKADTPEAHEVPKDEEVEEAEELEALDGDDPVMEENEYEDEAPEEEELQ